jgi:molecular chaperone GrpE
MTNKHNDNPADPDTLEPSLAHPSYENLLKQINEVETKANENWDLAVRTQADFENYKRRAEKDIEHAHKYANERCIREFLEVSDSIEYSVSAAHAPDANIKAIQKGLELTAKILHNLFEKLNLTQIDPTGESFTPTLHEAIGMEETNSTPANTVIRVLQKGYQLHGRVIRPARVIVAKTKEDAS